MKTEQSQVEITANGETHRVEEGSGVPSFLESLGLALPQVIIEYNGEAMTRRQAAEIRLHSGDRLEIVRIVAGG